MMKIAVSGCLLGEKIRFDAGHKRSRFVTDALGKYAEYVPFCPEHLAFGTPRPSVRLVDEDGVIRVRSSKSGDDVTGALDATCRSELSRIQQTPLCGIIFKSKSPSCGMNSAKRYLPNGHTRGKMDGMFAAMCREAFPLLPMEEEGRLEDAWLRENFVMQVFAYEGFERLKASSPGMKELVAFHTANKFMLQAKSDPLYRQLGRIVANENKRPLDELLPEYETGYKTAIGLKSSIKRDRNVLEHMAGFFKRQLTKKEKALLHEQIDDFAARLVPLIVPVSTIALFAEKYETQYLLKQTYLKPYPKALALRSNVLGGK